MTLDLPTIWVAIIAFFVLAEKALRNGLQIGKVAGVVLAALGVWVILRQGLGAQ